MLAVGSPISMVTCCICPLTSECAAHMQSMGRKGVSAVLEEEVANAMSVLARATAAPDDSSGAHAGGEHKHWLLHRKHNSSPSACRVTQQDLANCRVCSCVVLPWKVAS